MSNLIKYYNFNVTEEDKHLVSNDDKISGFVPGLLTHGEVEVRDLEREEFDEEFPEDMFAAEEEPEEENAEVVLQRAKEDAERILKEARLEANRIVEQAKATAQFEQETIREESRKSGYKDGLVQANEEVASQKKELELRSAQLEQQYEKMFQELEPDFVKLVMKLVTKLTGVLTEDRQGIITYLMEQSLKNLGKTSSLIIRVSEEDIELVRKSQERIREIVNGEFELDIVCDPSMTKNQCMIEADKQVIDCSLDVQLQGLMEDLKMLL